MPVLETTIRYSASALQAPPRASSRNRCGRKSAGTRSNSGPAPPHARPGGGGRPPGFMRRGEFERLFEGRFEALEKLVHARLQPLVLPDQRLAGQDAHHARVGFGKRQQRLDEPGRLAMRVGLLLGDAVGQRKYRALDEFDQAFVHLRLGGEMAVERSLGDVEALRKCGGGDLLPARRLEDSGQRLEDLEPALALLAFALLARHVRSLASWTR